MKDGRIRYYTCEKRNVKNLHTIKESYTNTHNTHTTHTKTIKIAGERLLTKDRKKEGSRLNGTMTREEKRNENKILTHTHTHTH